MGCGAISKSDDPQLLQQRYKKTSNICKNQSTQIWQCQQNGSKQKFLVKVFKNIFINQHTQKMYINFQTQIQRLRQIAQNQQKSTSNQNNENKSYSKNFVHYVKAHKDQKSNLLLIMKYIQNKSLGDYVKGKLPGILKQTDIAKYTQQILKSIKWLRSKGKIICCNIKPTNVFFSDQKKENIIIGDYYNLQEYFSLQQPVYQKDPIYAAPQNVILKQYFKETDIWRVGCFVLEMLTCIKPWYKQTTDINKIISNLKNQMHPPLPEKISVYCKDFLQKCFEPDHNRRASVQQLLRHSFITQKQKSEKKILAKNTQSQIIFPIKNTQKQQQQNYKLQVQNLEDSHIRSRKYTKDRQSTLDLKNQSPTTVIRKRTPSRRKQNITQSNHNISQNQKDLSYLQNYGSNNYVEIQSNQKNAPLLKPGQGKVQHSNRIKTENISASNVRSPKKPFHLYLGNQKQQILNLLNKNRQSQQKNQNPKFKIKTVPSKKQIKDSNSKYPILSLNKSKKKILQNKIMLNNEQIQDQNISSLKYHPQQQYVQVQKSIAQVMQQIQASGGKYYKKPLKLLKRKLKDKYTLRTETSITLQDSRMLQNHQMQEINFQNNYGLSNQSIHLLTDQSKISFNTHEEEVIQTAVSKAERNRYFTEQKILQEMRQNQKIKWQKELNQGKQLIKNQSNQKYYFSKPINKFNKQSGVLIQ